MVEGVPPEPELIAWQIKRILKDREQNILAIKFSKMTVVWEAPWELLQLLRVVSPCPLATAGCVRHLLVADLGLGSRVSTDRVLARSLVGRGAVCRGAAKLRVCIVGLVGGV